MEDIKLDGISFNHEHVKSFKNEADWLKHADENKHWFENSSDRTNKLKQVYALAFPKAAVATAPAAQL